MDETAFRLKFAPHFGSFQNLAGDDYIDQINFAADQGFRAWEDNVLHWRSTALQDRIARTLADRNMELGVFIAADLTLKPDLYLTGGDEAALTYFLKSLRDTLHVAERFGSRWVTVLLGDRHPSLPHQYQMANVVDALRQAADIVEPKGLTMVVEPVNSAIQRPTIFLSSSRDAYLICKAVNRKSCKILFDIYHHQIMDGFILGDIEASWSEIAYFQAADFPGRNEPMSGEINYINIFQYLHKQGFDGIIGMEHGSSAAGAEGERAVIQAYRYCNSFLV